MLDFTLSDTEGAVVRLEHQGLAIVTRTTTTVLSPATCTAAELRDWVQRLAYRDEEGDWNISGHPLLGYFNAYDDDIEVLVEEVASWLVEHGLSITDWPAYRWAEETRDA